MPCVTSGLKLSRILDKSAAPTLLALDRIFNDSAHLHRLRHRGGLRLWSRAVLDGEVATVAPPTRLGGAAFFGDKLHRLRLRRRFPADRAKRHARLWAR